MQDMPPFLQPGWLRDDMGRPLWDPNGPYGQLREPYHEGRPIGELVMRENPPLHGWRLGPDGTAIPVFGIPGQPPPEVLIAMQTSSTAAPMPAQSLSSTTDETEIFLLLL